MTIDGDVFSTNTYNDYSISNLAASSVQILQANSGRRYLIIQNISAVSVWINFGAAATAGAGSLELLPNGIGIYEQEGNDVFTGAVFAISSGSGNSLTVKDA